MEQTLGKRIAEHRKHLKLTQDQLAEQLGITAQAVSKWENDQSCPDISVLPKLAEIFGITTDELLGREAPKPLHEAQVVEQPGDGSSNIDLQWDSRDGDGKWELHWDSGKRSAVCFAVLVLLVGVLTLLSKIYDWDVSFWSILWPSGLLIFGLDGLLKKFSFFHLGLFLFGGYYLIDNLGIWQFDLAGELIFPGIIILIGVSLLVDALRKPKKPVFRVVHKSKSGEREQTQKHYSIDGETFDCSMSFGDGRQLISLPCLSGGEITCSFGKFTVDLSGCEALSARCEIEATCSFGEMRILVPARYQVICESSTAFAAVETVGHPDPAPVGIIHLDANASFGQITIEYI